MRKAEPFFLKSLSWWLDIYWNGYFHVEYEERQTSVLIAGEHAMEVLVLLQTQKSVTCRRRAHDQLIWQLDSLYANWLELS